MEQLAAGGAERGADRGCGEEWWREQTHRKPDGSQALGALANHVVGLLDREVALEVLRHDDSTVQVAAAPRTAS